MSDRIPVSEPVLDGNEQRYLEECIRTGWISSEGPFVRRFEDDLKARLGRQHAIAVCNGSAALDLAVGALRIGPGDEVILPTFTIISCAAAIVRAGATPVVVDCDPVTWNMDPDHVAASITPRTRAIMAVHTYGLPVDMEPILSLARDNDLHIIEDAAEVLGQSHDGTPCGSFGDISTFSFYPNKLVTCGEGGMVLTDDDNLAERCRLLRNLCFERERRFVHAELGWNFRMSNLQAAVGVAQLERLERTVVDKRQIGARYNELLADTPGLQLPCASTKFADNLYWVYGVVLDDSVAGDATDIASALSEENIATRPFFWPMHEQPVFEKMGLFEGQSCPVAERIARRGFYLPSGPRLEAAQQERVAAALRALLA